MAQELSDRLLTFEERCLKDIEASFRTGLVLADGAVRRSLRRRPVDTLQGDRQLARKLAGYVQAALGRGADSVRGLLADSVKETLLSVAVELDTCESVMPKRYVGVATEAMVTLGPLAYDWADESLRTYEGLCVPLVERFEAEFARQVALAGLRKESDEVLHQRLFAFVARPIPGMGGRGVWWRPMGGAQGFARGVSVELVNRVREAGMAQFNRAAEARE